MYMSPTMSNSLHEDNSCVVLDEHHDGEGNEQTNGDMDRDDLEEQEMMEQGHLRTHQQQQHPSNENENVMSSSTSSSTLPASMYPLPHHLRENCRPKPGMSCLRRPSRRSSSSSATSRRSSGSFSTNGSCTRIYSGNRSTADATPNNSVRFFDEIEEVIVTSANSPAIKQFKIKWPSATTEIRTRPRTSLADKSELFYSVEEIALFKREFRAVVLASRCRAIGSSSNNHGGRTIDTFYQNGGRNITMSRGSGSGGIMGGSWNNLSSAFSIVASTVKGVAKDVAQALTATSSDGTSPSSGNSSHATGPHMSMIDSMYIF